MEPPSALNLQCPNCGETPHRVLKGRMSRGKEMVFDGVVRCSRCGTTRHAVIHEALPIEVPVIVSWMDRSERKSLEMRPDETVEIGDRFEIDGTMVEVTSVESRGKRVVGSRADDTDAVWTRRIDKVKVKFAVNRGDRTTSEDLYAVPDEEFTIGDVVDLGKEKVVIQGIKVASGVLRSGTATAEGIERIYAKVLRQRRASRPWKREMVGG